jgi:hypothetical protein
MKPTDRYVALPLSLPLGKPQLYPKPTRLTKPSWAKVGQTPASARDPLVALLRSLSALTFLSLSLHAQPAGFNYDEAKVAKYTLPDLHVSTADNWTKVRRPQIEELLETQMYGRSPGKPKKTTAEIADIDKEALAGKAVRKQVTVTMTNNNETAKMDILIYLPAGAKGPVPLFLGLNFGGNHTVNADPGITLSKQLVGPKPDYALVSDEIKEKARGRGASQWQVEKILDRGYGLATIYYGDIDPDYDDGFQNGVHPLFYKPGQTKPAPDEWASVAAWAWGLSRALDYLETDKDIDPHRVAVMGHSRLGKAAAWAGAHDTRFAMVILNESGEGGAALSKRNFGETMARINTAFPHWFCGNYKQYNDNEAAMPFDSHMIIALMAPRPVYIASAEGDQWSDPHGEFLGGRNADPVYALFGKKGLGTDEMPGLHQPIMNTIAYHIRAGKHDVTDYDWNQYLAFADKHIK